MGKGVPLPSRLRGLRERRKLPQRGPGHSPGRNEFWCLELERTHLIAIFAAHNIIVISLNHIHNIIIIIII